MRDRTTQYGRLKTLALVIIIVSIIDTGAYMLLRSLKTQKKHARGSREAVAAADHACEKYTAYSISRVGYCHD